ncbi:AAA family ATPase [uncultured Parasutterella sp.]|jgi:exonuclease SbcC|uniref:AAA family ATPase n=1 Tax=uncultured Parasutterella sp. TaxID=1263098 RepID=UPI0025CCC777|nr:AAA family ATPase [uncultured Parasutterella sp.]
MQILKLSFENINSLKGAWTIDFQAPDFRSGIFAIVGPTGSGKTTILDAICLALYGHTPRIGSITQNANEVMNRDCDSCRSSLEFQTLSGRYRAAWSQKKQKNFDKTGKYGQVVSTMEKFEDGCWLPITDGSKVTSKKQEVQKIIGLSFDQFKRSVMLSQGDFAAFLKSKPNEKAQTLEQITGTQIYSLLSTKVYDLAEEQKKLFEDKQREVELNSVLDDAVVLTKQEQLKGITEEAKVLETQISKIEKEARWLSETAELRNQFLRVKAELERLEESRNEFFRKENVVRLAERAQNILPIFNTLSDKQSLREDSIKEKSTAENELVNATKSLKEKDLNFKAAEEALNNENLQKPKKLALFSEIESLDAEISPLIKSSRLAQEEKTKLENETADCKDRLNKAKEDIRKLEEDREERDLERKEDIKGAFLYQRKDELRDCKITAETLSAALTDAEGKADKASETVKSQEKEAEAFRIRKEKIASVIEADKVLLKEAEKRLNEILDGKSLDELTQEQLSFSEQIPLLEAVKSALKAVCDQKEEIVRQEDVMKRDSAELDNWSSKKEGYEKEIRSLTSRQEELEALVQINELTKVRAELKEGEPCPVCGSLEHPFAANLPPEVAMAKERLAVVKEESADLQKNQKQTDRKIDVLKDRMLVSEKRLKELQKNLDLNEEELKLKCSRAGLAREGVTEEAAAVLITKKESLLIDIKKRIAKARDAESKAAAAKEKIAGTKEELHRAEMAFSNAQTKFESAKSLLTQAQTGREKARTEIEQFWRKTAKEYGSVITDEELFAHNSELFKRWIAQAAKYEELLESCREIENSLAIKKGTLPGLVESVERLEKSSREKSDQAAELQTELKTKRLQRDKLFGTKLVEIERKAYERLLSQLAEAKDQAYEDLSKARSVQAAADQRLKTAEQRSAEAEKNLLSAKTEWTDALKKEKFESEEDWRRARLDSEAINALHKEITDYKAQSRSAADRFSEAGKNLAEKESQKLTDKSLEVLEAEKRGASAEKEKLLEQKGELQKELKTDEEARIKRAGIEDELKKLKHQVAVWDRLNTLVGSSSGDKYRRYVQSLVLLTLLKNANVELAKLHSRYRLAKGEGDMEIKVIDSDLADQERPTDNLSGGETFIVSLALALGLAQMASNNVRIDSLFLDEGFGTLDDDSLEKALNALSSLNAQGKTVGLISHVDQIKERIPSKIVVKRSVQPGVSRLEGAGVKHSWS